MFQVSYKCNQRSYKLGSRFKITISVQYQILVCLLLIIDWIMLCFAVVEFTKEVLRKISLSLKNANYYSHVLYNMSLKPFTGNFAKVSETTYERVLSEKSYS